jgi:3-hydroxyacyl-CoA dehydrogenase/3a,7a,12a-trihydroxy-5b-cholest-24-enoyl-CoA hydratase
MVDLTNMVVIITGSGRGLGASYADFFASRKCRLVLNDVGKKNGRNFADILKDSLESKYPGVQIVVAPWPVQEGHKIVQAAIDKWGRVDVLVNNAGILRDKSITKMSIAEWELVIKVHLEGTFRCSKAAFPYMKKQKFGRIINTGSSSGLFGNFGQVNYSAAKAGIHGLTMALAKEGKRNNIHVNTIAPIAATAMTKNLFPEEVLKAVDTKFVVPFVGFLSSKECQSTGNIYEMGGGWIAQLRWQRAEGVSHSLDYTPEDVVKTIDQIENFEGENDYPLGGSDSIGKMFSHYENQLSKNQTNGKKYKSETIFELMAKYLSQGHGANAIKKCNAVYGVHILAKKKGKPVLKYTIDLKNGNGSVKNSIDGKPDATFTMIDADFAKLCLGKLNPQMAFIRGKMKIKGSMKKATLFTPDLFPKPTEENFKKYLGMVPKL